MAGLSFGGALALELSGRHPATAASLTLASADAGWAGSLPADVAEQRLRQAFVLADLAPGEFVGALLPTMFSDGTPQPTIDAFGASMLSSHPVGFRAMAPASSEDLRDVLPGVSVPTLLIYGDHDVRAPLAVADHLHEAITGSKLVALPGAGHLCKHRSRASVQRRRPSVPARRLTGAAELPVGVGFRRLRGRWPRSVGLAQCWCG